MSPESVGEFVHDCRGTGVEPTKGAQKTAGQWLAPLHTAAEMYILVVPRSRSSSSGRRVCPHRRTQPAAISDALAEVGTISRLVLSAIDRDHNPLDDDAIERAFALADDEVGRLVIMADVVDATVFLVENRSVNEINLDIDGGWMSM